MDYLEGQDLGARVNKGGPLPVGLACEYVRQAALGLQHLYEQGLVHRDIKPSNLFLTTAGQVKVLDLGLARIGLCGADGDRLTQSGTCFGTLDYMAPEQWDDAGAVDIRADIYSLGCTLYHLLAGQPPFSGAAFETRSKKWQAHLQRTPADIRELRPDVPTELAELLDRMLAKKPEDRPQTPDEVAVALARFAEALPTTTSAAPAKAVGQSRRSNRRRLALAAGLLLVGLLGLALWAGLGMPAQHSDSYGKKSPSAGDGVIGPGLSAVAPADAPGKTLPPVAPAKDPLAVHLRVFWLDPEDEQPEELGVPHGRFRVRFKDKVRVQAELSEPAYAYLIGFNPTDKSELREQPFPGDGASLPPEMSKGILRDITLNDGVGLQAFAVLASRKPLLPYTQWSKERPPLPWRLVNPPTPRVVWLGNPQGVEPVFWPGAERATEEKYEDKPLLRDLSRRLNKLRDIEAWALVAFPVDPAN
jgi:hypothetical protein